MFYLYKMKEKTDKLLENDFKIAGLSGKPLMQRCMEGLILTAGFCIVVLRATFTEAPNTPATNQFQPLGNSAISLLVSMVLVVAALTWFACVFSRKGMHYRFSGIEIGLFVFSAAGVIAVFVASNKRFSSTTIVIWLKGFSI